MENIVETVPADSDVIEETLAYDVMLIQSNIY